MPKVIAFAKSLAPWLVPAVLILALYFGKLTFEQALALAVMLGLPSPVQQALSYFRKPSAAKPPSVPPGAAVLLLLSLSAASPALTSCAPSKEAESAMVARSAALAFDGAVVALEVLDNLEAKRIDAIKEPTQSQLEEARAHVQHLKNARDALQLVRSWLAGRHGSDADGKKLLGDAVSALTIVADELKLAGVQVPKRVTDGLQLARLFVGLSS